MGNQIVSLEILDKRLGAKETEIILLLSRVEVLDQENQQLRQALEAAEKQLEDNQVDESHSKAE